MISFSCSSCQKKLSTKDDLAGRKVKCPGCGQLTAIPAKVPAARSEATSGDWLSARPERSPVMNRKDRPTVPPFGKPDETLAHSDADKDDEPNLTQFLSPAQGEGELGRLGKYRILQILGHGGMGVVYKAEDPVLRRVVALKAMLPSMGANASARKRFIREAQAMAAVEHDHIVRIYEVGEERNISFLAMEFLKGEPLDARLEKCTTMPIADVVRLGREMAEGLAAAHENGLIHRDIKPGNLWLEAPKNRIKILDFGLARAATENAHLTQSGMIIGTPGYMAPEQARGEKVDARCDLFSLGVVLYRMSAGRPPFSGKDTVSTLMAIAMENPTPPQMINFEVPAELSDLIMALLEKDPAKRIGSAQEVVDVLGQSEDFAATSTRTTNKIKPATMPAAAKATAAAPRAKKKGRGGLALAAILGLASILAVAGVVLFWETPHGTVRIEIDDDQIEATLGKNIATLKGAGAKDISVSAGEHGLHIKRGDLDFDTDKFVLRKGDKVTLKVELLAGKVQVSHDGKVIAVKALPFLPVVQPPSKTASPAAGQIAKPPIKEPPAAPSEWVSLFNGKDLNGWEKVAAGEWVVQDGALKALAGKGRGWLATQADYADFEFEAEYRLEPGGNTGIFLRAWKEGATNGGEFIEIQLIDDDKAGTFGKLNGTGAIFGVVTAKPAVKSTPNTWHTIFASAQNRRVRVVHDGKQVVDANLDDHSSQFQRFPGLTKKTGRIGLQVFDTSVEFRNIRVRKGAGGAAASIPPVKANAFTPLFNGKDLTNWKTDSSQPGDWRVEKGVLIGSGGISHLFTEKSDYTDVHVRLKAKLNAGGNSGLYLRTQMTRKAGYLNDGYEAQIEYSNDQFKTGSIWGRQQADKDVGIPPDTWFWMDVIAKGNRIVVKVNDETTADYVDFDNAFKKGHLAIQCRVAPCEIQIASFEVKELPVEASWIPLFNGKDLAGWRTHPEAPGDWRVEEGCLVGRGPKKSLLFTERADYEDFQFLVECKINKAGNSGQLFRNAFSPRVNGDGYEIQIDNGSHPNRTGTVQVGDTTLAAITEALVPPDTWFTQEVIARGNRITVLVNGKQVADVVDPNNTWRRGHFALQVVDAPTEVRFRKIQVKPLPAQPTPKTSADPDRSAAEWVLSMHGNVEIRVNGEIQGIPTPKDPKLPSTKFDLFAVRLSNLPIDDADTANLDGALKIEWADLSGTKIGDETLKRLGKLTKLHNLSIAGTPITGAGLAHLQGCDQLAALTIAGTKIGDVGMANLRRLPNLRTLHMYYCEFTDDMLVHCKTYPTLLNLNLNSTAIKGHGLVHLKGYPLEILALSNTQVSDAELKHLRHLPKLKELELNLSKITDEGIVHIIECKGLKELHLNNSAVTDAGIKRLTAALPGCRVHWDGRTFEPTQSRNAERYPTSNPPVRVSSASANRQFWNPFNRSLSRSQ